MRLSPIILATILVASCGTDSDSDSSDDNASSGDTDTETETETESESETDECGQVEADQAGVKICKVIASPTESESVTLKNYDSSTVDISEYSLWDENAKTNDSGERGLEGEIASGETKKITSLGFGINDSGEKIYLIDDTGDTTVDTWSN